MRVVWLSRRLQSRPFDEARPVASGRLRTHRLRGRDTDRAPDREGRSQGGGAETDGEGTQGHASREPVQQHGEPENWL